MQHLIRLARVAPQFFSDVQFLGKVLYKKYPFHRFHRFPVCHTKQPCRHLFQGEDIVDVEGATDTMHIVARDMHSILSWKYTQYWPIARRYTYNTYTTVYFIFSVCVSQRRHAAQPRNFLQNYTTFP